MNTENNIGLPEISVWKAESLRLTTFLGPSAQNLNINWWTDVTGNLPEQKTTQPRTGEQLEQGTHINGNLALSIHPIRIEWRYLPQDNGELGLPNIGPFVETLDIFQGLMKKWLTSNSLPPIIRMAFGAVLLQPTDSVSEAYKLLKLYIPSVNLDSENSSDFLYQLNRPRIMKTDQEELKINRLYKWSASVFQNLLIDFNQKKILPSGTTKLEYACRLELDINTPADYESVLEPKNLYSLFEELIQMGKEIAEKGDRV